MNNREIAQKIFEKLLEKGAGIGNASIPIIEKVLDESSQFEPVVMPNEVLAGGNIKEIINMLQTFVSYGTLQPVENVIYGGISHRALVNDANKLIYKYKSQREA